MIDLRQLRDAQQADFKKNKIPAGATDGSVDWIRSDNVPVMGRVLVTSRHGGVASGYGCSTCPCAANAELVDLNPDDFLLLVDSDLPLVGEEEMLSCNGGIAYIEINDDASWVSTSRQCCDLQMQQHDLRREVNMRFSFTKSPVFALVLLVSALTQQSLLRAARDTPSTPLLSKRVSSLEVEGLSLVDALLKLGQQERVPLGIEYVTRLALEKPLTRNFAAVTVGDILRTMRLADKGYTWHLRNGVIEISHISVASAKENLLDRVIPEFSIPKCSLATASNLL